MRACATWSPGGAPSVHWMRPRHNLSEALHEPDQCDAAVARPGGDRRGHRSDRVRLGGAGPAGGGVRGRLRRGPAGRARGRDLFSCTTALHLALIVAGVSRGDDVVVPSFSFIATANAPTYVGARPVFADVDPTTGNLTAETVEAALTPATRAVIAVDQGGVPVDLDSIRALCDPRGITVIEDAACGCRLDLSRPAGRGRRRDHRLVVPPAQDHHHRRGRDDHHVARRLGRSGAAAARARDERVGRRPARQGPRAGGELPRGRLQLPDDRPAGRGRARPARRGCPRSCAAGGSSPRPTRSRSTRSPVCVRWPIRPGERCNFQSFWVEVGPSFPLDRDELLSRLAEADISARRGIMAATGSRRTLDVCARSACR